jgi:hypothetical protein
MFKTTKLDKKEITSLDNITARPASENGAWYRDPRGVRELRWWDGTDWTNKVSGGISTLSGEGKVSLDINNTNAVA